MLISLQRIIRLAGGEFGIPGTFGNVPALAAQLAKEVSAYTGLSLEEQERTPSVSRYATPDYESRATPEQVILGDPATWASASVTTEMHGVNDHTLIPNEILSRLRSQGQMKHLNWEGLNQIIRSNRSDSTLSDLLPSRGRGHAQSLVPLLGVQSVVPFEVRGYLERRPPEGFGEYNRFQGLAEHLEKTVLRDAAKDPNLIVMVDSLPASSDREFRLRGKIWVHQIGGIDTPGQHWYGVDTPPERGNVDAARAFQILVDHGLGDGWRRFAFEIDDLLSTTGQWGTSRSSASRLFDLVALLGNLESLGDGTPEQVEEELSTEYPRGIPREDFSFTQEEILRGINLIRDLVNSEDPAIQRAITDSIAGWVGDDPEEIQNEKDSLLEEMDQLESNAQVLAQALHEICQNA